MQRLLSTLRIITQLLLLFFFFEITFNGSHTLLVNWLIPFILSSTKCASFVWCLTVFQACKLINSPIFRLHWMFSKYFHSMCRKRLIKFDLNSALKRWNKSGTSFFVKNPRDMEECERDRWKNMSQTLDPQCLSASMLMLDINVDRSEWEA